MNVLNYIINIIRLDNFGKITYNINKSIIRTNNKFFLAKRIRGW